MKIILAPDKFKGSLTGLEFCRAVESGIKEVIPNTTVIWLPLSDGGDGTIEILDYHVKGRRVTVKVNDPLFKQINASYLYLEDVKTAFIEMAEASGMDLLTPDEQNCFQTTTLGTGELILDAIHKGAKTIILGIGGSATNDCGIGMATALGYECEDENGKQLSPVGKNLSRIKTINTAKVIEELKSIDFKVACDVTNPLYGENGAAYVYGPQKGASENEIIELEKGLRNITNLFRKQFDIDVQNIHGAGAAGGMGAGSLVFLNAELKSGIDLVKDLIDFDAQIEGADWIITGEGKLDSQTLSGKTIQGVMTSAKAKKIKVAAFCGQADLEKQTLNEFGISYLDTVHKRAVDFQDAMTNSKNYLVAMAEDFAKSVT